MKILLLFPLLVSFHWAPAKGVNSCLACDFNVNSVFAKPSSADPCNDLFGAACLTDQGKIKVENYGKDLEKASLKSVLEIRDEAAQKEGFKNIREALRAKLKDGGIPLKENPDGEALKFLLGEPLSGPSKYVVDSGVKTYLSIEKCNKEQEELLKKRNAFWSNGTASVSEKKAVLDEAAKMQASQKKVLLGIRAKDLVGFYSSEISSKCSSIKASPEYYKKEENQEVYKVCENVYKVRSELLALYRQEGLPGSEEKAMAFLQEYSLPSLKYSNSSQNYTGPEKTETQKLSEQIDANYYAFRDLCSEVAKATEGAGRKIAESYLKEIAKSKTTVDKMIDVTYTPERKEKIENMFATSRESIGDLISSFVKDPKKKSMILDEYEKVELSWLTKPPLEAYEKNKAGTLVLKAAEGKESVNPVYSAFEDPSLSYFTTINAFYKPEIMMGKVRSKEQVAILPAILQMVDSNPYALFSVLAHEAGHKIGPRLSEVNGHGLKKEYEDLLACYKDRKSIKMEDGQSDETIADYISSEILAREIQKLPKEKRRTAVVASMEPFCAFESMELHNHRLDPKESHAQNKFRIDGVFGANPSLRKVMSCEKDSEEFRTCGLNVSILDLPEAGSGNSKVSSPKKGSK